VRLLKRTTRRQRLTEFGTAYYQRCLEVLGLVATPSAWPKQTLDEPRGTLRITAPLTFGTERLAPASANSACKPAGAGCGADQSTPGLAGQRL
jgi:DNA-binding transcriptional LysR family regulator